MGWTESHTLGPHFDMERKNASNFASRKDINKETMVWTKSIYYDPTLTWNVKMAQGRCRLLVWSQGLKGRLDTKRMNRLSASALVLLRTVV